MPDHIHIRIDDRRVRHALNRLIRLSSDLTPAMRKIAGALEAGIQETFETATAPEGKPWAPLSETIIARRLKKRPGTPAILVDQHHLAASITSDYDPTSAIAGSNLVYATTHQFGAKKGLFGKTRHGAPIPWGDIPARPFGGLSPNTAADIIHILNTELRQAPPPRQHYTTLPPHPNPPSKLKHPHTGHKGAAGIQKGLSGRQMLCFLRRRSHCVYG